MPDDRIRLILDAIIHAQAQETVDELSVEIPCKDSQGVEYPSSWIRDAARELLKTLDNG